MDTPKFIDTCSFTSVSLPYKGHKIEARQRRALKRLAAPGCAAEAAQLVDRLTAAARGVQWVLSEL